MILRIADFDELVLKCRTEEAKDHITEAIACYYTGAYRACLVTPWIAVVFDIIKKLYELNVFGEKSAKTEIDKIEKIQEEIEQRNGNRKINSQNYESNLLKMVKEKFELFDQQQYLDLVRLQEDRHRCAHPTFQKIEELYKPSAELARLHLRNAIEYVLSQPPVQGKSALNQLIYCVKSQYFPTDIEHAKEELRSKGLLRPKHSLIKSFVTKLILDLFQKEIGSKLAKKVITAIKACLEIDRTIEKEIINLLDKKISTADDSNISSVIYLIFNLSQIFEALKPVTKRRIYTFITEAPIEDAKGLLQKAAIINDDELRKFAKERIDKLSVDELSSVIKSYNLDQVDIVIKNAVKYFCEVQSWNSANEVAEKLIFPLISQLTKEHISKILKTAEANEADLIGSHGFHELLERLYKEKIITLSELKEIITDKKVKDRIFSYFNEEESEVFS